MDLNDFLENKRKPRVNYQDLKYNNYQDRKYNNDNQNSDNSHSLLNQIGGREKMINIFNVVRNNKKLQLLVGLAILLIMVILIALIIILLPAIIKLISYVSQNGLQGILRGMSDLSDTILKGLSK